MQVRLVNPITFPASSLAAVIGITSKAGRYRLGKSRKVHPYGKAKCAKRMSRSIGQKVRHCGVKYASKSEA